MSIPKGWQEVRLGDICDVIMGQSPSSSAYNDEEIGLPLIQGNADVEDRLTAPRRYTSVVTKTCDVGDILMSVRAPVGSVFKSIHHACIGRGVAAIKPKQNKEFIYQFLLSIEDKWISQGSTFGAVNRDDIESKKIKLPPLKEQEKIAEILSSCDEHIKNLKNLKSELEKEKLHLMNELLSGKTRFSSFTTPWQEVALKDLGEYRRGSFPQPYGNKEWYDGEGSMPFVQVFDVDDNFKLKPTTLKRISKLAQPKSIFIPKGSVIITIQGSIGRTAITQYDCYLDRTLLYFEKFLIPIDKKFFMYALFSVFEVEKLKAPGGTIKTITKEALSDFKIKLPSLEEQKKIGEVLSACDERLQCLNELITAQTTLKSHLLTELLSGNIRVNI